MKVVGYKNIMKIQILMSTYNGEQYIRTQLDSIVAQTVANKTLLIRDDGSTDNTINIIREYQAQYPWITLLTEKNVGVQKSFFNLIKLADEEADFISFADQDDQWLPEKLQKAVERLNLFPSSSPVLYCGDKIIVGKNLEDIPVTVGREVRKATFGNALVQNICTGCTAVINQALLTLLKKHLPKNQSAIVMHDWWLYLTATCFGDVYYDQEAFIRYRQHGNNASGAMLNRRALIKYRLSQLLKPRGEIYRQIKEFRTAFRGNIGSRNEAMIFKILRSERCLGARIALICDRRIFRQKKSDDLVFRGIVLIGKL